MNQQFLHINLLVVYIYIHKPTTKQEYYRIHTSHCFGFIHLLGWEFKEEMDGGGVSAPFSLSKGMNYKPQQMDHIIHGEEQEQEPEPHVLAVDDNLIDRKIVEKLLKNSSCKVTTAENGLRALEYLGLRDDQENTLNSSSGSKVNMIITDYCMPGMSGYELLKKIKESSILKEVPVVIMSSENIPTRINKCLEEGAQMFMLKPLKQSDVKKLRGQLMKCGS